MDLLWLRSQWIWSIFMIKSSYYVFGCLNIESQVRAKRKLAPRFGFCNVGGGLECAPCNLEVV
jgi:hypothetical protein